MKFTRDPFHGSILNHETSSLESMPISSEVICPNISLGVPNSKQFLISLSILFLSTWSQLTSNGFDQFVLSSLFSMQYDSTYEINNGRNEDFNVITISARIFYHFRSLSKNFRSVSDYFRHNLF